MIDKIKNFLGLDIDEARYKLSSDPQFGMISDAKKPDKWVFSTCGYCGVGCGLYIGVKNGEAVYTKGNPKHAVNMGTLCPKGLSEHQLLNAPDRILHPQIRRNGVLEDVTWQEAFETVSTHFKRIADTYGSKAVGIISTGQMLT